MVNFNFICCHLLLLIRSKIVDIHCCDWKFTYWHFFFSS